MHETLNWKFYTGGFIERNVDYHKNRYLLPLGEKQSVNTSSRALPSTRKLGERETIQIHLSANEFAGIR